MVDCKIFCVASRIDARPLKGKSGASEKIESKTGEFFLPHITIYASMHLTS